MNRSAPTSSIRRAARPPAFLGIAQGDVLEERPGEEEDVLQHEPDAHAQVRQPVVRIETPSIRMSPFWIS
jgi:hypothetical protein